METGNIITSQPPRPSAPPLESDSNLYEEKQVESDLSSSSDSVISIHETIIAIPNSDSPVLAICRICLDDDPTNMIHNFCGCKHGASYAHLQCMLQWIYTSRIPRIVCEICHYPFNREVIPIDIFEPIQLSSYRMRDIIGPGPGHLRFFPMSVRIAHQYQLPSVSIRSENRIDDAESNVNNNREDIAEIQRVNRTNAFKKCFGTAFIIVTLMCIGIIILTYVSKSNNDMFIFLVIMCSIGSVICCRSCATRQIEFNPNRRRQ